MKKKQLTRKDITKSLSRIDKKILKDDDSEYEDHMTEVSEYSEDDLETLDLDSIETELNEDDEEKEEIVETPLKKRGPKANKEKYYVEPKKFDEEIVAYYTTGVLSDDLAEMVNKIAHKLSYAPNFINYCVDSDTEALTKRGWLKYNEIDLNDSILSYNLKTKHLVWSKIKDIFIGDYDDLMFKLDNIGIDALVTPNHKFVSLENGIKPIEEFKTNEHLILIGDYVKDNNTKQKFTDDFVKIVGWAVTEGSYLLGKKTHSVQIFQKEGYKCDEIRNLLNNIKVEYKEYNWTNPKIKCFRLKGETANKIVQYTNNKILSMEFILSLSQKQRLLLIETMIKGDGWNRKNSKNKQRWSYCQKDKKHVDSFIALCTISGLTTSTTLVKKIFGFTKEPYYNINIFQEPKTFCLFEKVKMYGGRAKAGGNRMNRNIKPNKPTVCYKGKIWCPQTEFGTFVCRRGKYVYITGNTYREDMVGDALIRMFKALMSKKYDREKGTNPFSYFTRIAFNAFRNRIKKEKHINETHIKYQAEFMSMSENYNSYAKNNRSSALKQHLNE